MIRCPICKEPLVKQERSCRCVNNHCFDIAKQGYVNLLPVQQKHSAAPGDSREQVVARRAFLSRGFYQPIADALVQAALNNEAKGPILDIGCGEGYYSARLAEAMHCDLIGIDISKEAVRCAAAAYKAHTWLCATASHLPIPDSSVGTVTSLFCLTCPEEFHRCLISGGTYIQIIAAEDHLRGLKSIIYPKLLEKEKEITPKFPGFSLISSDSIQFTFTVEGEQVQQLLSMTPHAHRITKDGAQRLAETETLTDTASCILNVYKAI